MKFENPFFLIHTSYFCFIFTRRYNSIETGKKQGAGVHGQRKSVNPNTRAFLDTDQISCYIIHEMLMRLMSTTSCRPQKP
jgi:hypothetical protein